MHFTCSDLVNGTGVHIVKARHGQWSNQLIDETSLPDVIRTLYRPRRVRLGECIILRGIQIDTHVLLLSTIIDCVKSQCGHFGNS
jgi:hypothetical protein